MLPTAGLNANTCVDPSEPNCRNAGMVLNGGVCVTVTKASCEAADMVISTDDMGTVDTDDDVSTCAVVNETNCGANGQYFDPRPSDQDPSAICVDFCPNNHANVTDGTGMCAACQNEYRSTNGASCACPNGTADPTPGDEDRPFACLNVITNNCSGNGTLAEHDTKCDCNPGYTGDTCENVPTASSCAAIQPTGMFLFGGACVEVCPTNYAGDSTAGTCTQCSGDYTSTNGNACGCAGNTADPNPNDSNNVCETVVSDLTCNGRGTAVENNTRCECNPGWTGDTCGTAPTAATCAAITPIPQYKHPTDDACVVNCPTDYANGQGGMCDACAGLLTSTGGAECSCADPNVTPTTGPSANVCSEPSPEICAAVGKVHNVGETMCVDVSVTNCAAVDMVANARDENNPTACVAVSDLACRNIGQVPNQLSAPTSCVAVSPSACAVLSQVQNPNNAEQCIEECPQNYEGQNFVGEGRAAGRCDPCSNGRTSDAGKGCECGGRSDDNKVEHATESASACLVPNKVNCESAHMVLNDNDTPGAEDDTCVDVNATNCRDNGQYFDGVSSVCLDNCPPNSVNQTDGSCEACRENYQSNGGNDACSCRGDNVENTNVDPAVCLTPDETNCPLVGKVFSNGVCESASDSNCYADNQQVFDPTADDGSGGKGACAANCGDNYERVSPTSGACRACVLPETSTRGNSCECSGNNEETDDGRCLAPSEANCEAVNMVVDDKDNPSACVEVTDANCAAVGEYVHPHGTDPDSDPAGSAICLAVCPTDYQNQNDGTCFECVGLRTSSGGAECSCPSPNVTPITGANSGTCSAPSLENCRDARTSDGAHLVLDNKGTADAGDDVCVAVTSDACDKAGLVINSAGDACVAITPETCLAAGGRIPNALTNPNRCVDATPSACAVLNMVEDPDNAGTCIAQCPQDYEGATFATDGQCDACTGGFTSNPGGACGCGARDDNDDVLNSDGMCVGSRAVVVNQPDAADGMITLMVNGAGVAAEDLGAVVSDATLVFGAVPADNDHYVLSWSGDCATPGATGETLAGGATTECRIEPGTTEVTVGATFGDVRVCESENREDADGAGQCGMCSDNFAEAGWKLRRLFACGFGRKLRGVLSGRVRS